MMLKNLAAKNNILIGTAVAANYLFWNKKYRDLLKSEYSSLTCENAMKWGTIRESRKFNFKNSDFIVNFALKNNFKVRGHTLVWSKSLPKWLIEGSFAKDEIRKLLTEHIENVVGRYREKIFAWDVVNEALRDDGSLDTNSFWYKNLGEEYISLAFRTANKIDHSSLLFLNEWGADSVNKKSDALLLLVRDLKKSGVPIHGIGFQMHVGVPNNGYVPTILNAGEVSENFARFEKFGLDIHITEMDVQRGKSGLSDSRFIDEQANIYKEVIKGAMACKKFKSLTFWGLTDRFSWVPKFFQNKDYPLLFDRMFLPKKAYFSTCEALSG